MAGDLARREPATPVDRDEGIAAGPCRRSRRRRQCRFEDTWWGDEGRQKGGIGALGGDEGILVEALSVVEHVDAAVAVVVLDGGLYTEAHNGKSRRQDGDKRYGKSPRDVHSLRI